MATVAMAGRCYGNCCYGQPLLWLLVVAMATVIKLLFERSTVDRSVTEMLGGRIVFAKVKACMYHIIMVI